MASRPHWSPDADFASSRFLIRRMDTAGYIKPADVPEARLPLIGFVYVTSGEVLADVGGTPFLCQPEHPWTTRTTYKKRMYSLEKS